MTDVARVAGVSQATVSNVLNRPHKVAAATRLRVEAVIAKLGYVPNSAAAELRRGRGRIIGLVVPNVANPFYAEVARGAVDVAFDAGFVLMLCDSDGDEQREAAFLRSLEVHRAVGVLVSPLGRAPALLGSLPGRGTQVVLVDRPAPRTRMCSVSVDDVLGGELAVEHLLNGGARTIAMVRGPLSIRQCADRRRGAQRALVRAGLSAESLVEVSSAELTLAGGVLAARQLLAACPTVDGIFCTNDLLALGVMRETEKTRLVPDDVSIVGYDDIEIAADATVPLTSVAQPQRELGRRAAELLIGEVLHAESHEHERVQFDPQVIVRESTRRLRSAVRR